MNIRVGRYLIYGLIAPRDRTLFYIGKTHKRREWRLAEHIKHAMENDQRPVYEQVREILLENLEPEIFVWEKISPDSSWRDAEKEAIFFWKNFSKELPYINPPQTKKSNPTEIKRIALLNATNGG